MSREQSWKLVYIDKCPFSCFFFSHNIFQYLNCLQSKNNAFNRNFICLTCQSILAMCTRINIFTQYTPVNLYTQE